MCTKYNLREIIGWWDERSTELWNEAVRIQHVAELSLIVVWGKGKECHCALHKSHNGVLYYHTSEISVRIMVETQYRRPPQLYQQTVVTCFWNWSHVTKWQTHGPHDWETLQLCSTCKQMTITSSVVPTSTAKTTLLLSNAISYVLYFIFKTTLPESVGFKSKTLILIVFLLGNIENYH
jgi:hypothetical protein